MRSYMDYCRIEIEYICGFLLGYLWNKNISRLDDDAREYICKEISRPSIGTVVDICRRLDLDRVIFGHKKLKFSMNAYPDIRNEYFGHGFVFDDYVENVASQLDKLSTYLCTSGNILSKQLQIILVIEADQNQARGIRFGLDNRIYPWRCEIEDMEFEQGNLYAMEGINEYVRLSPFIVVTREREYYIYKSITDRMTGRTEYNQLLRTGSMSLSWPDFSADISHDGVRRKSVNGTILNNYQNNYKEYVDVGIKAEIKEFLTKDRTSVSGTIWGHGGVGKTATVQSICDDLSLEERRRFDYIVFASAKDRTYKCTTGKIAGVDRPIDSFQKILECINSTMNSQNPDEIQEIVDFEGRILVIIDDYETFSEESRSDIDNFLDRLDVNKHKVLITTRANVIRGKHSIHTNSTLCRRSTFLSKLCIRS